MQVTETSAGLNEGLSVSLWRARIIQLTGSLVLTPPGIPPGGHSASPITEWLAASRAIWSRSGKSASRLTAYCVGRSPSPAPRPAQREQLANFAPYQGFFGFFGVFPNWKHLTISSLRISLPKSRPILQKNGGIREIILHFFLRFSGFLGFFRLQPVAFQQQAALQPLQKKSCLKTYRRFSVHSAMCHNRRMKVENNNWKTEQQAEKWGGKMACSYVSAPIFLRLKWKRRPASCL